jgi:hypothetical protein
MPAAAPKEGLAPLRHLAGKREIGASPGLAVRRPKQLVGGDVELGDGLCRDADAHRHAVAVSASRPARP